MKANWDVALNSAAGKCIGIGVIIRDDKEVVFTALSRSVEACPVLIIAEAMGALHAIEFCQDSRLSNIMLEGDSLQLVQVVNAKGE
jgi:ribonuclease HI